MCICKFPLLLRTMLRSIFLAFGSHEFYHRDNTAVSRNYIYTNSPHWGFFFSLFKEWTGGRNRCLFYLIMKTMSNAVYYFRLKAKSHNKYLVCACICVQMVESAFLNTLPLIVLARLSAWLLSKHFCVF